MKQRRLHFWLELILPGILAAAMGSCGADLQPLLHPPGLRLISDPATAIPATHQYLNPKRELPQYRDASATPLKGWSMKFVKTRRFSSDQSAWVYYRQSDFKRTRVVKTPGQPEMMRIWPVGTILVLEGYKGDASRPAQADLREILVMTKLDSAGFVDAEKFFSFDWSYARYTPDGVWSLSGEKLNECHQCHRIAFRLTGDLVFFSSDIDTSRSNP